MNTFRYKTTPRLRRMLLAVGAAVAALAGVAPAKATAVPQPVPLPHVPIPTSPSLPLPSLSVPGLHVPGAPGAKAPQTNARPINGGTGGGNCLANGGTGRPDAFVQDPATGGIQSQFDGWVQVAPSNVIIGGVYSKIDTYLNQQASGAVGPYTPADGDSNAWTGLGGAGHATLLYQIGYIKTGSQIANGTNYNLNVFWEVLDPASQFNNVRKLVAQLTSVNAAPHYYTTLYDPVGQHFTMEYDGTQYFNDDGFFVPNQANATAETHSLADQLVGGATDAVHFAYTDIWVPAGSGGSWQPMNGNGTNTMPRFANQPAFGGPTTVDSQHFYVWDQACNS